MTIEHQPINEKGIIYEEDHQFQKLMQVNEQSHITSKVADTLSQDQGETGRVPSSDTLVFHGCTMTRYSVFN
jgi:hypothetical protein